MQNTVTVTTQDTSANSAKFTPELLKQTGDFSKYERLVAAEPKVNWLGWCAKIYKKNHRVSSVGKRIDGARCFLDYLRDNADTLKLQLQDTEGKPAPLISQIFERVRKVKNAQDSKKYRVFDEFSTWCDSIKGYKPNTTWGHVASVKSLAKYCDTGITNDGFKDHVSMPTATALDEEYPPNDIVLKIIDACPPHLRTYLLYICDTGAEPIDAARLHKDMIYFDEKPVRVEYRRKKTTKPITQFLNDYTANALKSQLERSVNGYVFAKKELKNNPYNKFYRLYSLVLQRINLTEKIDGTKTSKYHFKIFKKRFFTMGVAAGIPEYVIQGMLGRKKYLDQYMALPLDQKREFGKKILRKVAIYSTPQDEAERRKSLALMLGLPESQVTPELEAKLKSALFRLLEVPQSPILNEIA